MGGPRHRRPQGGRTRRATGIRAIASDLGLVVAYEADTAQHAHLSGVGYLGDLIGTNNLEQVMGTRRPLRVRADLAELWWQAVLNQALQTIRDVDLTAGYTAVIAGRCDSIAADLALFEVADAEHATVVVDVCLDFTSAEVLADGDMETAGVGDWTAVNSVLTKSIASPHSGAQALRVTTSGVAFAAAKPSATTMVVGREYRVRGWARGDGAIGPRVAFSATDWNGAASTSWQYFDVTGIATSELELTNQYGGATVGYWSEFDDISVVDTAGNFELVANGGGKTATSVYHNIRAGRDFYLTVEVSGAAAAALRSRGNDLALTEVGTESYLPASAELLTLGESDGGTTNFEGAIYGLWAASPALSTSDRATLEGYVAARLPDYARDAAVLNAPDVSVPMQDYAACSHCDTFVDSAGTVARGGTIGAGITIADGAVFPGGVLIDYDAPWIPATDAFTLAMWVTPGPLGATQGLLGQYYDVVGERLALGVNAAGAISFQVGGTTATTTDLVAPGVESEVVISRDAVGLVSIQIDGGTAKTATIATSIDQQNTTVGGYTQGVSTYLIGTIRKIGVFAGVYDSATLPPIKNIVTPTAQISTTSGSLTYGADCPVIGAPLALGFSGAERVDVAGVNPPDADSWTFESVVKLDAVSLSTIAMMRNSVGLYGVRVYCANAGGPVAFLLRGSSAIKQAISTAPNLLTAGASYHIACVLDRVADIAYVYMDSILSGSVSTAGIGTIACDDSVMRLGDSNDGVSSPITGSMAMAAVHYSALSAAEIRDRYRLAMGDLYADAIEPLGAVHAWEVEPDEEWQADGDMEATGTGEYTAFNALLSKSTASPHSGSQALRITIDPASTDQYHRGRSAAFSRSGDTYRASGWLRGDGVVGPYIYSPGEVAVKWNGTSSTSWQYFDISGTTTAASYLEFTFARNPYTGGEWIELDDLSITVPTINASALAGSAALTLTAAATPGIKTPLGCGVPWAVDGDGTDAIATVAHADIEVDFDDDFTIVIFAKLGSGVSGVVGKGATDSSTPGLGCYTQASSLYWRINASQHQQVVGASLYAGYCMIALQVEGSTKRSYVFNSTSTSSAESATSGARGNASDLTVGSMSVAATTNLGSGKSLSQPMIFDRALSDTELRSIWRRFARGDGLTYLPLTGGSLVLSGGDNLVTDGADNIIWT